MKRLFFLFVFIFIGFGAFGHIHNNSHFCAPNSQLFSLSEYSSRALYADTIPKKKRVDEWYIKDSPYGILRYAFDFGGNHTMFKDDFMSDITFGGFGYNGSFSVEMTESSFAFSSNLYLQITPAQPTKSYRNIIAPSELLDYDALYFNFYLNMDILFRLAKTSHYIGSHMSINAYGGNNYYLPPIERYSMSIGFAHTYYSRIFGIPTQINTTLPILIGKISSDEVPNVSSPFFIDFFNPIVDVMWFFNSKFNENIDFRLSYTFNYINVGRKFSTYRNVTNSISVGVLYSIQ